LRGPNLLAGLEMFAHQAKAIGVTEEAESLDFAVQRSQLFRISRRRRRSSTEVDAATTMLDHPADREELGYS
jgi:hypothetical protein